MKKLLFLDWKVRSHCNIYECTCAWSQKQAVQLQPYWEISTFEISTIVGRTLVENHRVFRRGTIIPTNWPCENHSSFLSKWKYKFEPMWTHFRYAKHIQISQEKITHYLPNHHCLYEFFEIRKITLFVKILPNKL